MTDKSSDEKPFKSRYIKVGDFCVFKNVAGNNEYAIGKAIQFIEFCKDKQKSYKGNYVDVTSNCGILCTWYVKSPNESENIFEIETKLDTSYHHVGNYVCSLTLNSFKIKTATATASDFRFVPSSFNMGKQVELTSETAGFIASSIKATKK